jgi:hypothetical protein
LPEGVLVLEPPLEITKLVGVVQEVIGLPQGHQAAVHLPKMR